MLKFRIPKDLEKLLEQQSIEVWDKDELVGCIYTTERGIRVTTSKGSTNDLPGRVVIEESAIGIRLK